jgi:hypothetical protein
VPENQMFPQESEINLNSVLSAAAHARDRLKSSPLLVYKPLFFINAKKLSSLQRKLMTKNDTSKTANMKLDGSV